MQAQSVRYDQTHRSQRESIHDKIFMSSVIVSIVFVGILWVSSVLLVNASPKYPYANDVYDPIDTSNIPCADNLFLYVDCLGQTHDFIGVPAGLKRNVFIAIVVGVVAVLAVVMGLARCYNMHAYEENIFHTPVRDILIMLGFVSIIISFFILSPPQSMDHKADAVSFGRCFDYGPVPINVSTDDLKYYDNRKINPMVWYLTRRIAYKDHEHDYYNRVDPNRNLHIAIRKRSKRSPSGAVMFARRHSVEYTCSHDWIYANCEHLLEDYHVCNAELRMNKSCLHRLPIVYVAWNCFWYIAPVGICLGVSIELFGPLIIYGLRKLFIGQQEYNRIPSSDSEDI